MSQYEKVRCRKNSLADGEILPKKKQISPESISKANRKAKKWLAVIKFKRTWKIKRLAKKLYLTIDHEYEDSKFFDEVMGQIQKLKEENYGL